MSRADPALSVGVHALPPATGHRINTAHVTWRTMRHPLSLYRIHTPPSATLTSSTGTPGDMAIQSPGYHGAAAEPGKSPVSAMLPRAATPYKGGVEKQKDARMRRFSDTSLVRTPNRQGRGAPEPFDPQRYRPPDPMRAYLGEAGHGVGARVWSATRRTAAPRTHTRS